MTRDVNPETSSEASLKPPLRLFVAIELPLSWKTALGRLQTSMQDAIASDPQIGPARIRWVRPENIHLTLKFIGNVAEDRLETIASALTSAVPGPPVIELELAAAGAFSDSRAPRVIWATVHVKPQYQVLHQLFAGIETWLAAAGVPRDRRSFAPHLTLARLPEDIDVPNRRRIAEVTLAVPVPHAEALVVEHVSLMRSHLGHGGTRYERLAIFPP